MDCADNVVVKKQLHIFSWEVQAVFLYGLESIKSQVKDLKYLATSIRFMWVLDPLSIEFEMVGP